MEAVKAPRLFLDMDGVFSDFEFGYQIYRERAGKPIQSAEEMDPKEWSLMFKQNPNFFADLPPMPEAMNLWGFCREYCARSNQRIPIFLTGCPTGANRLPAEKGKRQWIATNLLGGAPIEKVHVISLAESATEENKSCYLRVLDILLKHEKDDSVIVIFCKASQKHLFSGPNQILVDDKEKNGKAWEENGGIFIHHQSQPEIIVSGKGEENYSRLLNKGYRNYKSAEAVGLSIRALSGFYGGRRRQTRRLKRRRGQTRK